MKKAPFILSAVALAGVIALAITMIVKPAGKCAPQDAPQAEPSESSIVFFDIDRVASEYDMANDLRSVVETKAQSISEDINRRGSQLQKDMEAFQDKIDKGLMTRSTAEVQGQKLQERQNSYQNYVAQKQQEIQEEEAVMMNKIGDAINTYVDKFRENKGYAMVFSTTGGILPAPIVSADSTLDVTDAIIEGLNSEYVKEKEKSDK